MRKVVFKIGIIGCGAVVEAFYLPAIQRIKKLKITALVDKNLNRARKLRGGLNQQIFVTTEYKEIISKVDIVIIALPHFLHAPVSLFFLKHKIHVLCEKPMALNPTQAKEMIKTEVDNKVKLAIGMMRRQFSVTAKIKKIIQSNYLGKIISFDYEEGFPYDWPVQSKFIFDKNQAGGGVLIDMGAHVVDLLVHLFRPFGELKIADYRDDNYGGVEANCIFNMIVGDIKGRIELSNDRRLRNTFRINFTKGLLELPSGGLTDMRISIDNKKETFITTETFIDAFYKQLNEFIRAIYTNSSKYVAGKDVLTSIELIHYCYKNKKQIYEPWYTV